MVQLNTLKFYLNSEGGIALSVSLIFEYFEPQCIEKIFLIRAKRWNLDITKSVWLWFLPLYALFLMKSHFVTNEYTHLFIRKIS